MLMDKVSICLTSCGRWELLQRTVSSLLNKWDGPAPWEFFIHDDSGELDTIAMNAINAQVQAKWGIHVKWTYSSNQGQVYAIDALYAQVCTEYIFHCEDDWEFIESGFVHDSIAILKHDALVSNVWLRFPDDRNGHPAMNRVMRTQEGLRYQYMAYEYNSAWNGMTWNPGMRRLSDYLAIGKFSSFCRWSFANQSLAERDYNKVYMDAGLRGATLTKGYIRHTGGSQSIKQLRK